MDSALNKTALNKTMTSSIAERLSRAYEGDPSTPQALIGIWASAGPHFQDQFDIESPRGRANLRKWWLLGGRAAYPGLEALIGSVFVERLHLAHLRHAFLCFRPEAEADPAARWPTSLISPLVATIYRERADLRAIFDIESFEGILGIWQWLMTYGAVDYFGDHPETRWRQIEFFLTETGEPGSDLAERLHPIRVFALAQMTSILVSSKTLSSDLEQFLGIERLHLAHLRHAFLCFRPEAEADPAARWPTSLISPLVATIYRERADLRAIFDIESFEGILGIWQWLLTYGAVDYFGDHPETRWRQIEFFLTETGEPGSDLAERLHPIRVFALAQMTSILVSSKTLSSDLEQFLGIERLHLAHLRHAFLCFRPEAEADPAARWPTSLISPLVATIYRERADLRAIFDIESFEGILGIWQWLLTYGAVDYFGDHPETRWRQIEFFLTETGEPGSDLAERLHPIRVFALAQMTSMLASGGKLPPGLRQFANIAKSIDKTEGIPPLLQIIHRDRSDLTAAFDLKTKDGTGQFIEWWKLFGHEEFYGQHDFAMTTEDASDHDDAVGILNTNVSPIPSGSDDQAKPTVSLIGYPKGEFGLGEDIRLLRRTLGFAGLSPSVIKAPWKIIARQAVSEDAIDVDEADLNCDVMIYVLPAFDTLTLLGKVGTRAFSAKRKIGYWQWELDKFPAPAAMAFELIDEVWCHSEHAAKAFRTATNKPVIKVPLPVEILNFQKGPRAKYEIDEESFAIFTSFDGASSISRKNPMASILAFEQAFPRNRYPNVQLILKAMNALNDPLWRDCLRKALIDDRIQIRNEVMDRREYYELLSCCDAVLSLHRAEGFGRLMADSMAIGIPVIATAYSGNLDFMTGDNSWLVDGTIIPLIAGDYPFTENQEWMEADVTKAALALKECYEDENRRMTVIQNAKQTIKNYFPENCASIYADLLNCPRQTIFPAPNNMGIAIHDPDKTRST